jgi:hypothetical protein
LHAMQLRASWSMSSVSSVLHSRTLAHYVAGHKITCLVVDVERLICSALKDACTLRCTPCNYVLRGRCRASHVFCTQRRLHTTLHAMQLRASRSLTLRTVLVHQERNSHHFLRDFASTCCNIFVWNNETLPSLHYF